VPVVREIITRIAHAEGRSDIRWNERFERGTELWGPGGEASITNKLKRGTFAATFMLACLAALELEGVHLEEL
jgi:Domain of unknown function (DUF6471)